MSVEAFHRTEPLLRSYAMIAKAEYFSEELDQNRQVIASVESNLQLHAGSCQAACDEATRKPKRRRTDQLPVWYASTVKLDSYVDPFNN